MNHSRSSRSSIVVKNRTQAANRQMQEELNQLEPLGKPELKDPGTHAVGLLKAYLLLPCTETRLAVEAPTAVICSAPSFTELDGRAKFSRV